MNDVENWSSANRSSRQLFPTAAVGASARAHGEGVSARSITGRESISDGARRTAVSNEEQLDDGRLCRWRLRDRGERGGRRVTNRASNHSPVSSRAPFGGVAWACLGSIGLHSLGLQVAALLSAPPSRVGVAGRMRHGELGADRGRRTHHAHAGTLPSCVGRSRLCLYLAT